MKTNFIITIALTLFVVHMSYAQLTSKPNGSVFDVEGNRLSYRKVSDLLASNAHTELLELYRRGKIKKTVGNGFIIGGVLLMTGDFLGALLGTAEYPGILTYVGGAFILVSIPIKVGFSKSIQKAVEGYNHQRQKNNENTIKNIAFISDRNGVGVSLTF